MLRALHACAYVANFGLKSNVVFLLNVAPAHPPRKTVGGAPPGVGGALNLVYPDYLNGCLGTDTMPSNKQVIEDELV